MRASDMPRWLKTMAAIAMPLLLGALYTGLESWRELALLRRPLGDAVRPAANAAAYFTRSRTGSAIFTFVKVAVNAFGLGW